MTEAASPRKARKSWLIAPLILAALAAVAWCGWWFYGAGKLQNAIDAQAKALAGQGVQVSWTKRGLTGFPMHYVLTFDGFQAKEANGWGLSTDRLEMEANAYNLGHWVAVAPGPVTLARTDGTKTITVSGRILRMSASHFGSTPPRISVEGVDLKLAGATPFATISRFETHLKPEADKTASFFLRIDKAGAAPDTLLARIANGKTVTVGLDATLANTQGLKGSGLKAALRNWAAAGGALNIKQGGIQAGDALLSLTPTTTYVAPDGTLRGELGLQLSKASEAVLAMGAVGVLPPETAAVASGAASMGQVFSTPGKPINATLTFRDGQTLLGPLPLGPAPRLF